MAIPAQVKPAAWGAVGGAIAAMISGFVWGGWGNWRDFREGSRGRRSNGSRAEFRASLRGQSRAAARSADPPKKESSYARTEFVIKAGWVDSVAEKYRRNVAEQCASAIVEAMDVAAAKKS